MTTLLHAITPGLAHVGNEANLLVTNVRAGEMPGTYQSVFAIDGTHPYLYENPAIANHVSGTTFIDMARQLLKAISHLYWDAPLDCRFILHNVDIEFLRWAELGVDIEVTVAGQASPARKPDALRSCEAALEWRQRGHLLAKARSRFTILSAALEARLMERQYRQARLGDVAEAPASATA